MGSIKVNKYPKNGCKNKQKNIFFNAKIWGIITALLTPVLLEFSNKNEETLWPWKGIFAARGAGKYFAALEIPLGVLLRPKKFE